MRVLLVGQAPGPNTNPLTPLYPLPLTSSGGRLAQMMGLSPGEYLETFDRANLLQEFPGRHIRDDRFPVAKARIAAGAMRPLLRGRDVVFVGRNVGDSFGHREVPFHWWSHDQLADFWFAVVPHTSGRSRWYNDPANVAESREFWRDLIRRLQPRVLPFAHPQGTVDQRPAPQESP